MRKHLPSLRPLRVAYRTVHGPNTLWMSSCKSLSGVTFLPIQVIFPSKFVHGPLTQFLDCFNIVLTSEGYKSPFIGFIIKGECHVLRKVDVPFPNHKTGKVEKRMKQVVVGKLAEGDSFGEVSVSLKEPMTCSIVTEQMCRMGIIPFDKISREKKIQGQLK